MTILLSAETNGAQATSSTQTPACESNTLCAALRLHSLKGKKKDASLDRWIRVAGLEGLWSPSPRGVADASCLRVWEMLCGRLDTMYSDPSEMHCAQ